MRHFLIFILVCSKVTFAWCQVYTTITKQAMQGNKQYTYSGTAVGRDSVSAAENAKKLSEKALEIAKTADSQRGQIQDSTGIGLAVISEMYTADITSVLILPIHFDSAWTFEAFHGANFKVAGRYWEPSQVDYSRDGSFLQTKIKQGARVEGIRKSYSSGFDCSFIYTGYTVIHENIPIQPPLNFESKMDTMTNVYYQWTSTEKYLKKKEYKQKYTTLYNDIKNKLINNLGAPVSNDDQFDNDKNTGKQTVWRDGKIKLEFLWNKTIKAYKVRYSQKN